MARVRLLAFRKATSSSTTDTTYELDLSKAPNISVNYQFSDIKEPDKRKGTYSQTFKLPFTKNNNTFFENWFDVNIEGAVFNTGVKFEAALYVGTVPQMEGSLQLRAVYKKAQYYEVSLFSNTADLFSVIGEQRLKDVFRNENGSYNSDLNHTFTATNVALSWDGDGTGFVNEPAGVSLQDATSEVQKVMYPLSISRQNFYYNDSVSATNPCTESKYLKNGDGTSTPPCNYWNRCVDITQLRPAIQLKEMVKRIIGKSGFSYTSSFIDGGYFGKLFMTTCGHLGVESTPTVNSSSVPSGYMEVGHSSAFGDWGVYEGLVGSTPTDCGLDSGTGWGGFGGNASDGGFATKDDPEGVYTQAGHYFTKLHPTMNQITLRTLVYGNKVKKCGADCSGLSCNKKIKVQYRLVQVDTDGNNIVTSNLAEGYGGSFEEVNTATNSNAWWSPYTRGSVDLDISEVPVGTRFRVWVRATNWQENTDDYSPTDTWNITLGKNHTDSDGWSISPNLSEVLVTSMARISWNSYSVDVYDSVVDVPACIDPEITQKAFLKDIIQRFNLIVVTDPNNAANLIIEPYSDYIAQGGLKYWTDKLDTSKEIIIKDTVHLQKKLIHFTDKEDVDYINKEIKEEFPSINVYGHIKREEQDNQYAKGEIKNDPVFAPYINSKVWTDADFDETQLPNMVVQYEYSYSTDDDGIVDISIEPTQPKLFYYNGKQTSLRDDNGDAVNIYMHSIAPVTDIITAHGFGWYPLCTPYECKPSGGGAFTDFTLTTSVASLYWDGLPPVAGDSQVFNYEVDGGVSLQPNSLYHKYWKPYLDELYSTEARVMECYLNLNEIDILNFKYNDEIFIKDTYWRILTIQNYQVGQLSSTKVTLIKVVDSLILSAGCSYQIVTFPTIGNTYQGFYLWGEAGDVATLLPYPQMLYTNPQCCVNSGGRVIWNNTAYASTNRYQCEANASSMPISKQDNINLKNILSSFGNKSIISKKIGRQNTPLVRGSNVSKYNKSLVPSNGDDIVIKYHTTPIDMPAIKGENHRMILIGHTDGTTTGYAYAQGDSGSPPIKIPTNTNCRINTKITCTVIGGTDASQKVGHTDIIAHYTAFININGGVSQIGNAGGIQEYQLNQSVSRVNAYIDVSGDELRIGLVDTLSTTKRVWTVSLDMDIQAIDNLNYPYEADYALYQDQAPIQLQNYQNLLWN
jgi:hypothetical protein